MGKVKRLELCWQLYLTSLPVRDVRNVRPLDFCWTECTLHNILYTSLRHCCFLYFTTLHYCTRHCTTLLYSTLHYPTLQYTAVLYATLHCCTLHYITLLYYIRIKFCFVV